MVSLYGSSFDPLLGCGFLSRMHSALRYFLTVFLERPVSRAIARMLLPIAFNSCNMIIEPLPSTYFPPVFWLVSEGYFARGWVNSFSLLLGQLYTGGDNKWPATHKKKSNNPYFPYDYNYKQKRNLLKIWIRKESCLDMKNYIIGIIKNVNVDTVSGTFLNYSMLH